MPRHTLTADEVEAVRRAHAELAGRRGAIRQIAARIGLHLTTIVRVVHRRTHADCDPDQPYHKGDALTPARRVALLERYDAGETGPALACEFGIMPAYIVQFWLRAGGQGGRPRLRPPEPPITAKLYPACGVERPVSDFYRNRALHDGLTAWCASCMDDYRRAWQERTANTVTVSQKRCRACERVLWEEDFHRSRSRRDGRNVYCKDYQNEFRRARRWARRRRRGQ